MAGNRGDDRPLSSADSGPRSTPRIEIVWLGDDGEAIRATAWYNRRRRTGQESPVRAGYSSRRAVPFCSKLRAFVKLDQSGAFIV
jgi:hypothetical protein